MKFTIERTSRKIVGFGGVKKPEYKNIHINEIEINTLEELMELQKKAQSPIIIDRLDLEIYDDWRE